MPLNDIQIRNAKPGLRPVRQNNKDEESASPEQRKAKGKTAGKKTKSEKLLSSLRLKSLTNSPTEGDSIMPRSTRRAANASVTSAIGSRWKPLLALQKPAKFLRQGLSINALKRIASALSDTDAARRMQQAKSRFFEKLRRAA